MAMGMVVVVALAGKGCEADWAKADGEHPLEVRVAVAMAAAMVQAVMGLAVVAASIGFAGAVRRQASRCVDRRPGYRRRASVQERTC